MFRNIFITIRNLRRSGVYSIINIAGLAMSLATCAFIVLWVQDEKSYDRFHKDAEQIYMTIAHFKNDGGDFAGNLSPGAYATTAKELYGDVQSYCRMLRQTAAYLQVEDIKTGAKTMLYADSTFFSFFNFPIVKGSTMNILQTPEGVVISEKLATELFGDEDPVGKTILLENWNTLNVTAVMKNMPRNTSLPQADMICPFQVMTKNSERYSFYVELLNGWDGCEYLSYMKLRPGADIVELEKQFNAKQPERMMSWRSFTLQPLVNMHLYSLEGEPTGAKTVSLFQWIALVILVIACINYVNLVTARATKRHREIGLKKIIGAKKWELFLQLISEAVVLFVIAIITALILNLVLRPVYEPLSGKEITFGLFDINVWGVYFAMLLAVVALAGIYPAYLLASFKPTSIVQSAKAKRSGNIFRKMLVVTQFVASTTLIVGTIVLGLQMRYIREKDMGYDRENVLICSLGNMAGHYEAVKAELEQQASILGVTAASNNIMEVGSGHGFGNWEGKTGEGTFFFTQLRADTSFFRVMDLRLIDGTVFKALSVYNAKEDDEELPQFVLNETAVKKLGMTDPVGKWVGAPGVNISGVVKDFHFQSLHEEIGSFVIFYEPSFFRFLFVRTRAGNVRQAIAAVEEVWKKYNTDIPFDYHFMDDTFDRMYKADMRTNWLFSAFSIIAIIISCMGLLGLVVYTAELKTKEIGIRKVLGAKIFDIVNMLTKEFLILVGIAIVIAVPLSYYWLDAMLQDFAYRISLGWWMFAAAALITVVLTILTVGWQAIKAATKNPVEAIKTE